MNSKVFYFSICLYLLFKNSKMDMRSSFGERTRLEKLLDSLRVHLFMGKEQEVQFLETVKQAVIKDFVDEEQPQQTSVAPDVTDNC